MGTAVTQGVRKGDIKAIAVASDVAGPPASPCGMCRQFIREFCEVSISERTFEVILCVTTRLQSVPPNIR